jgi:hypothetical protein
VSTAERSELAASLFAQADRDGSVPLLGLTEVDECVLGNGEWLLTDAVEWTLWLALSDRERASRTADTLDALCARGLAERTDDPLTVGLAAPLGLVQVARSSPAFVLLPQSMPARTGLVAPIVYGVCDEVAGLRGLVVELRRPGRHDYRLTSVDHGADGLARWVQGALTSEVYGGRVQTVVLETVRHREGGPAEASGLAVEAEAEELKGTTLHYGGTRARFDADDLGALAAAVRDLVQDAASGAPR